jgi:hypothetical protein
MFDFKILFWHAAPLEIRIRAVTAVIKIAL